MIRTLQLLLWRLVISSPAALGAAGLIFHHPYAEQTRKLQKKFNAGHFIEFRRGR